MTNEKSTIFHSFQLWKKLIAQEYDPVQKRTFFNVLNCLDPDQKQDNFGQCWHWQNKPYYFVEEMGEDYDPFDDEDW